MFRRSSFELRFRGSGAQGFSAIYVEGLFVRIFRTDVVVICLLQSETGLTNPTGGAISFTYNTSRFSPPVVQRSPVQQPSRQDS